MGMHVLILRRTCPYLGPFFNHNSANFGPIGLKNDVNSGDYCLLSIDLWWEIQVMMLIFDFWFFGPLLAGKWAWPPLMVWGLQTRPKSWPTGWNFWAYHYIKIIFSNPLKWNINPPASQSGLMDFNFFHATHGKKLSFWYKDFVLIIASWNYNLLIEYKKFRVWCLFVDFIFFRVRFCRKIDVAAMRAP